MPSEGLLLALVATASNFTKDDNASGIRPRTNKNGLKNEGVVRGLLTAAATSTYVTGGVTPTAAMVPGIASIWWINPGRIEDAGTYYIGAWDNANGKLQIVDPTTGGEIAGATDIATWVMELEVVGRPDK